MQQSQTYDYRPRPRSFRRPRLLIIGCGDIGQRVARLKQRHWQVLGVARSPDTLQQIRQSGARALAADSPAHPASPTPLMKRLANWATHIVHTAPPPGDGQRRTPARPGSADASAQQAADPLTQAWLNALKRPGARQHRGSRTRLHRHLRQRIGVVAGPRAGRAGEASNGSARRRLVYISTTGVYGNRHDAWVAETSPNLAQTARAQRRVDAERLLRSATRRSPHRLSSLILRVPGIYAADRLPTERLKAAVPALLPADDVITNHIHADDLARLIVRGLSHGGSQRLINTVDDTHLRLGDYLDLVAEHTGLPRPPRRSRAELEQELSPSRMSFMRESRRIANQRLKRELRLPLRYPTVQDFFATWAPASEKA